MKAYMTELHFAFLALLKGLYEHLEQLCVVEKRHSVICCCASGEEVVLQLCAA